MRPLARVLFFALILATAAAPAQEMVSKESAIVIAFVDAFNAHDPAAMAEMVTDDVQWLAINGDAMSVDAQGKKALTAAMAAYFEACPSCRSEISGLVHLDSRVSVIETAHWESKDGPRSQSAFAVYELRDGLIRRVYYFPAE